MLGPIVSPISNAMTASRSRPSSTRSTDLTTTARRRRRVPNVFGMNFQVVSVGQKLVEKSIPTTVTGGYLDAAGTPSAPLLGEIQFADASIGKFVAELKKRGLYQDTAIIITAKHGQSPIDPNRVLRIPADNANDQPPSVVLSPAGNVGAGLPGAAGARGRYLVALARRQQRSRHVERGGAASRPMPPQSAPTAASSSTAATWI